MKRSNNIIAFSFLASFYTGFQKNVIAIMIAGILLLVSTTVYASGPVKPLSKKALKQIELKYDKDVRALFSGKKSDKNVLALKRLIAENVDPDLAIAAIKRYNEAKKYRSGSVEKRTILNSIEELFTASDISWKKCRDIIIKAGGSISARKTKTMQRTYNDHKKPSCHSKKTVTKRGPKIKYQDPDLLAENALLMEMNGRQKEVVVAVVN